MSAIAALILLAQAQEDPVKKEVVNKLNSMRVTLDLDKVPLEQAVDLLRELSGLNVAIHESVRQKLPEDRRVVTLKVKDLLLKSALKLMLENLGITATYSEGVVLIATKEHVNSKVVTQVYDVAALMVEIRDFPGPSVELTPGRSGARFDFFLEEAAPKRTFNGDFIIDLIRTVTGDRAWDDNPKAAISLHNGKLIVTQTVRVHKEIGALLGKLEQFK
jgi:hypothetical protein